MTTRTAWFHCFSGIAGDMALGALVDAGADLDELRNLLGRLPLDGWAIEAEPVVRSGIAATKVHVHVDADDQVVRTAAHIIGLIKDAGLPEEVRERSLATFKALAEAEGRLHRRPPEQVHFHEVGGIDAIIDVVGTCGALHLLDVGNVCSSAVANGTGMVRAAHGLLPNPVPAVVDLLENAPTYGVDLPVELTTPTGAALLAANVTSWGPLPPLQVEASGFGAGSTELNNRPNAVQVIVGLPVKVSAIGRAEESVESAGGEPPEPAGGGAEDTGPFVRPGQPVLLFEANLDDATGEVLAHTIQALLDVGAHDAWVTPIVMKKGRPAHVVSVLTDPAKASSVASTLASETGSLGVRGVELERWPLARTFDSVEVDGLPVRVKVSHGRVKVEHDDAAEVARLRGRPLRHVLAEAEDTARANPKFWA